MWSYAIYLIIVFKSSLIGFQTIVGKQQAVNSISTFWRFMDLNV